MKTVLRILAIVAGVASGVFGIAGVTVAAENPDGVGIAMAAFFLLLCAGLMYFALHRSPQERAEKAAWRKTETQKIETGRAGQEAYAQEQAARRAAEVQQDQPAPKRPKALGFFLLVLGLCIFIFGISMQTGSRNKEKADVPSSISAKGEPEVVASGNIEAGTSGAKIEGRYGPGDTVRLNDVQITFHGITETIGDGLFTPEADRIFVIADFTVENNSKAKINISSVFGSDAYCDDYLVSESMEAELGDPQHRNNLTGSLDPGRKMRGIIGYELPAQWRVIEIILRTDWWRGSAADTITFAASAA